MINVRVRPKSNFSLPYSLLVRPHQANNVTGHQTVSMLKLTCDPGKCFLGVASFTGPKSPQQRMKYSTALAALQGLWDVTYLGRREHSAIFTLQERGVGIGHGKLMTGTFPHLAGE